MDQPHLLHSNNDQNMINTQPLHLDQHHDLDLDHHHANNKNESGDIDHLDQVDQESGLDQDDQDHPFCCVDNYPPESYAVCHTKVADWLDRNTFIERNPSVKFGCSNNQDPCQTPVSRRSVTLNQKPKLSIIGFRKKPAEPRSKQNDKVENVRLFRNRSEPGRDYCLLITEPVSPKVSCVGRVGSVRVVQGRKPGVWRSFKATFSNLIRTNGVRKIAA